MQEIRIKHQLSVSLIFARNTYKAPTNCVFNLCKKYEGTKNKHELFEQVRKEMAEDRERRQTGEREDDSSDDDDDDEVKAPNLRARSRRRLAQNETPVVAFNSTVNGGDESPRPGPSGVHAHGSVEPDDGGKLETEVIRISLALCINARTL